jgi:hypothetical protein
MKKRITSTIIILALMLALMGTAFATSDFTDVASDSWYASAVSYATENGLFTGMGDGTFAPLGSMNRAMFVVVLARIDGADLSSVADAGFADVPAGKYYTDSVNWAYANDYVKGMGNNSFSPATNITREQAAVILYNYMTSGKGDSSLDTSVLNNYADSASIAS